MSLETSPQKLGFPHYQKSQPRPVVAQPTPLPNRPRGRWFISSILLGLATFGVYQLWNSSWRYRAYGTVVGRTIELAPPWDGVVRYLHVREGDQVRSGQVLVSADNLQLRQRCAQLDDEARVARANLEAEVAKLKWQSAIALDQASGAVVAYYELWGSLLEQESRLEELTAAEQRAESLRSRGAVSGEELERTQLACRGQASKVERLRRALDELKRRADVADGLLKQGATLADGMADRGDDQLKPLVARIESLQAERTRVQQLIDEGEMRAPTNGLVVRLHRFAGERCEPAQPVVSVLEAGSLEIVLYLSQKHSSGLAVGDTVEVLLEPYADLLSCRMKRLGDEFVSPPEALRRHYRANETLLPAYFDPSVSTSPWIALRVGSLVKLPLTILPNRTTAQPAKHDNR